VQSLRICEIEMASVVQNRHWLFIGWENRYSCVSFVCPSRGLMILVISFLGKLQSCAFLAYSLMLIISGLMAWYQGDAFCCTFVLFLSIFVFNSLLMSVRFRFGMEIFKFYFKRCSQRKYFLLMKRKNDRSLLTK